MEEEFLSNAIAEDVVTSVYELSDFDGIELWEYRQLQVDVKYRPCTYTAFSPYMRKTRRIHHRQLPSLRDPTDNPRGCKIALLEQQLKTFLIMFQLIGYKE